MCVHRLLCLYTRQKTIHSHTYTHTHTHTHTRHGKTSRQKTPQQKKHITRHDRRDQVLRHILTGSGLRSPQQFDRTTAPHTRHPAYKHARTHRDPPGSAILFLSEERSVGMTVQTHLQKHTHTHTHTHTCELGTGRKVQPVLTPPRQVGVPEGTLIIPSRYLTMSCVQSVSHCPTNALPA